MNPAILFVDDEPRVLDGLRDLLRRNRRRWDLDFAVGPDAGLEALSKRSYAVVVSDMRMPKLDGAALLAEVRRRSPESVRVVLSGQMERETALRAIGVAHQFLTKPCDAEQLTATIEGALSLRDLLANAELRTLVGEIDALPALASRSKLLALLSDPRSDAARIAKEVSGDPALAAKLLQVVNSSFFGVGQRVTSVERAVTYLGSQLLTQIIIAFDAFHAAGGDLPSARIEPIVRASAAAAAAAGAIADRGVRDECVVASLLSFVGMLIIASRMPEVFDEITSGRRPPLEVERERLGVTHAHIGGYLLGLWGFAPSTVLAVARHHDAPSPSHTDLERAVRASAWLADQDGGVARDAADVADISPESLERGASAIKSGHAGTT